MSFDLWRERSQLGELRGVIDPNDVRGIKNRYIDTIHRMALVRWCLIRADQTILDYGCGTGRFTEWFACQARLVYGLDVVWEMLGAASERHRLPNAQWIVGDGRDLPWGDATIDLVATGFVLQYILDEELLATTLLEFRRVLKPQGRVMLMEQVRSHYLHTLGNYVRHRSVEDYERALEEAGLTPRSRVPLRAHSPLTIAIGMGLVPERLLKYAAKLDAMMAASALQFAYKDYLILAEKRV